MPQHAIVIGSGFAGLSAAAHLAQMGWEVEVLEKNEGPGGRASVWESEGYRFDMGPSWYWMPDVIEDWFADFDTKPSDFYDLIRLDPSYRVYFEQNEIVDVPASSKKLGELFESWEPGASKNLEKFLKEAAWKYRRGMDDLARRPSLSFKEFMDPSLVPAVFKLQLFKSYAKHVRSMFKNERIQRILEFPVYFLGGTPNNTPALYSLMSYADLELGTWYPMGGMHELVKAMVKVCQGMGVQFHYQQEVEELVISNGKVKGAKTSSSFYEADVVLGAADYHHVEQHLLPAEYRQYDEKYWDKRVMAPSSLIFYLGIDTRAENLEHHNLFFDASFEALEVDIYEQPRWPKEPLFYVNVPSLSDPSTAPAGCENIYILLPVAPGMEDSDEERERLFDQVMLRIAQRTGQDLRPHIKVKRSFAHRDFESRYHAYKGNAYGLANTLMQTAIFKPRMRNPKLDNLFYAGQLTVPGPGLPPSLMSGKMAAEQVHKSFGKGDVQKIKKTEIKAAAL